MPLDDEATFELIRSTHTLGCFQIESPGPARAGRQVRAGDLRRPHHRHLAVPARPGQVRHGHAVPAGPAGLAASPSYLHPNLRARAARRPTASSSSTSRCCRSSRVTTGVTLAEADEVRRALGLPGGPARGRGLVAAGWPGPRLQRRRRRPDLGGAQGVRVVRLLQGARRGLRAADLPVGLAQGPPPGRVPRRRAHPRPGHVPQAADPRRRPQPRHRRAGARRQRLRRHLPGRAGRLVGRAAAGDPGPGRRRPVRPDAGPRPAPPPDLPDGRAYGIRLSLADVKGISDGRGRRGSSPAGPTPRSPTSGTAPRSPARSSSGSWWPAASTPSTASGGLAGPAAGLRPPRPGDPARPAAAGRRARPLDRPARSRPGPARGLAPRSRAAAATAVGRAGAASLSRSAGSGHRTCAAAGGRGPVPGGRGRSCRPPSSRPARPRPRRRARARPRPPGCRR